MISTDYAFEIKVTSGKEMEIKWKEKGGNARIFIA